MRRLIPSGLLLPAVVAVRGDPDTQPNRGNEGSTQTETRSQAQAWPIADAASRERLEGLAKLGFWRWRACDDQVTWSPGYHQLLGRHEDEPRRAGYDAHLALLHPEDRVRVHETIQHALRGRTSLRLEARIPREGEPDRRLEIHLRPVGEDGEAEVRATVVDATERRAAERELANTEGGGDPSPESLGRTVSRSLHAATARLLGPMRDAAEADPPSREALAQVEQATDEVAAHVASVAEACRHTGGTVEAETVELRALIDEAVTRAYASAAADRPTIRFDVGEQLPDRLRVDGDRLVRALEAAITAALSHGPTVAIQARLASRRQAPDPEPDRLEACFDVVAEHHHANAAPLQTPQAEVAELLTRRLAADLDGSIQARDEERGLRLLVPAREAEERAQPPLAVLVAAADPDARERIAAQIPSGGFEVHTAASGDAALSRLAGSGIDAVLATPDLGALDAFTVAEQIRDELPAVQQPYLAIVAPEPDDTEDEAAQAGVDEIWTRPLDADELAERLASLVRPRLV